MTALTLHRIQLGRAGAAELFARLRVQLSAQGNIVSARGRERTEGVFGEALPPVRVVERSCGYRLEKERPRARPIGTRAISPRRLTHQVLNLNPSLLHIRAAAVRDK